MLNFYIDEDHLCAYTFLLFAVSVLKHPRAMSDYQTADSESLMKRLRPNPHGEEVINWIPRKTGITYFHFNYSYLFGVDQVTYPAPIPQVTWSLDDLPRVAACSLAQGSNVTSMDFHPSHHTLLLGRISLSLYLLFQFVINFKSILSSRRRMWCEGFPSHSSFR